MNRTRIEIGRVRMEKGCAGVFVRRHGVVVVQVPPLLSALPRKQYVKFPPVPNDTCVPILTP